MAPSSINVLSLCAGIGGLDLGFRIAVPRARTVCMVEGEAYAAAILATRMRAGALDDCPIWSDARTFDGKPWRGVVDFVIAGIPCQGNSIAGKRTLENDPRNLWPDTRRILRETGAWGFLLENVPGILVPNRGLGLAAPAGRILAELAQDGWDAEWGTFSAAQVGASHKRERFFLLAYKRGERRQGIDATGAEARATGRSGGTLADPSRHGGDGLDGQGRTRRGVCENGRPVADAPATERRRQGARRGSKRRSAAGGAGAVVENAGNGQPPIEEPRTRPRDGCDIVGNAASGGTQGTDLQRASEGEGIHCPVRTIADVAHAELSGTGSIDEPAGRSDRPTLLRQGDGATGSGGSDTAIADVCDSESIGRTQAVGWEASDFGPFALGPLDPRWAGIIADAPHLAPAVEPRVHMLADGSAVFYVDEHRAHQLRAIGNAVVPLTAAVAVVELDRRLNAG